MPYQTIHEINRHSTYLTDNFSLMSVIGMQITLVGGGRGRGRGALVCSLTSQKQLVDSRLQPAPEKQLIIDRFYIALFSAREQTHCARMWFYMSE